MNEETFTAEQALAALSFLSDNVLFGRKKEKQQQQREDDGRSCQEEAKRAEQERLQKELERLIPDWIEQQEEEEEVVEDSDNVKDNENALEQPPPVARPAPLERLGPDVSALVLSHLSVSELSTVSLVSSRMHHACRRNELWRTKFVARWNYSSRLNEECAWFEAYKAAYANPHDLWVTHWNCVAPHDGDSPGRCCVSSSSDEAAGLAIETCEADGGGLGSPWMRYCPTCRYSSCTDESLPEIVQQAVRLEEQSSADPVDKAEVMAAAHALLLQEGDTSLTSPARATFATTQYSIAKWCRRVRDLAATKCTTSRRAAFGNAATFHRQIRVDQYRSDALHFLTDVLFFSVVDSHLNQSKQAIEEKEHLRSDLYVMDNVTSPGAENTVSSLGPHLETSHHSWHIVRFTNPDYVRPIMFRIFFQRTDCFTVFPSEGFLKPGETCHIVLGVRLLGSLLSEAFEALNVQREEVDPFLADVYAHEAHLPYAPFAIRYMFAPVIPCIPPSFTSRGGTKLAQSLARPALTQAATSKYKHVGDYVWENVATEATVRTLYLSAHVHANYRFEDFQRATLTPFDIRVRPGGEWGSRTTSSSSNPMVYVAPNMLQKDSAIYESVANVRLELELSDAGEAYRTEKRCLGCLRDWGARSEELGRAFVLQRLVCDVYGRQKSLRMRNLVTIVRHVYSMLHLEDDEHTIDLQRVNGLLYVIHGVLIQKRADPVYSHGQRQLLLQLECVTDDLTRTVQESLVDAKGSEGDRDISEVEDEEAKLNENEQSVEVGMADESPWRNVGVYRCRTCTDSVYGHEVTLPPIETELPFSPLLMDEPDYLDGFRYLCHSPGRYCLGPQQDPNHEDPTIVPIFDIKASPISRVINRGKRAHNTDVFMDNTTLAFACALSMIHDPRSLLVHGLYDRVYYPGTGPVRRFALPSPLFRRPSSSIRDTDAMIERSSILAKKWKSQNLQKRSVAMPFSQHQRTSTGLVCSSSSDLWCLQYAELDVESHELLHLSYADAEEQRLRHVHSLTSYLQNVPPPGVGRFLISSASPPADSSPDHVNRLVSLHPGELNDDTSANASDETHVDWLVRGPPGEGRVPANNVGHQRQQVNGNQNGGPQPFVGGGNGRGPRVVNLLWLMSAHFGWTVDDTQGAGSVLVDRKILIASQYVSNSLVALPLLWTLLARNMKWISTRPVEYYLDGLPYEVDNELKYLSARECGSAAVIVLMGWFMMGRYAERRIGRSFERSMMEHLSDQNGGQSNDGFLTRKASRLSIWYQRLWDKISPMFLQRLVFSPRWNRRSETDVRNHVAAWRNKDLREHRSKFDADDGQGEASHGASVEDGGPPIDYKEESSNKKLLAGLVVALGSFSASSPHFFLNLLTVFSCSIALGMTMSLQSMEVGRRTSESSTSTQSMFKPLGVNTVVIAFFLVGQLVGSSGGVLFLAEFVVTSMSLLLGGAGTISASAMESWGCFFCLSSTAFWGYLFARVALIDGIRHKRRRPSSVVLCACLAAIAGLWLVALLLWRWEMPPSLMIVRPLRRSKRYHSFHLQ